MAASPRTDLPPHTSRLIFANQLRGLAALCVVVSHFIGVFWGLREFVGLSTGSPVIVGAPPAIFALVSNPWFNFGPFGVGVFFLLSGLVIPLSLGVHTRRSFAAARLLRIYPTYLASLIIEMTVLHASAAYWHKTFPFSDWQIAENGLLIHTALGQPVIDLVNWTLCIEMKFYLVLAALAGPVRAGKTAPLFWIASGVLAAHLVAASGVAGSQKLVGPGFWQASSYESLFLMFLFIGVLFSFHHRGQLSTLRLLLGVGFMFVLFSCCWPLSSISGQFPVAWLNYCYALGLFALLYAVRARVRPVMLLDVFAAISFPLYLVHAMVGFCLLKWLMLAWHLSYGVAVILTFLTVVCLATTLHLAIEKPTMALGHRLSRSRV